MVIRFIAEKCISMYRDVLEARPGQTMVEHLKKMPRSVVSLNETVHAAPDAIALKSYISLFRWSGR